MSLRTLSLLPLLALTAPAFAGERVLVAGADGVVYQADSDVGDFAYFSCVCTGPVNALAVDGKRLFVGDEFGTILVANALSGDPITFLWGGVGEIRALAAAEGSVFAGSASGLVSRVDPLTGDLLEMRTTPAGVNALVAHQGFLYAGTADGAVYRAPLEQGAFEYFACFCFFDIQDLAVAGEELIIADSFGTVVGVRLDTGEITSFVSVGPMNAMARRGEMLFVHSGNGFLPRIDPLSGAPLPGALKSPIDVRTILLLGNPGRSAAPGQPAPKRP